MRITERIQYLASLAYYFTALMDYQSLLQTSLIGTSVFFFLIGFCYEGIRVHQIPCIFGVLLNGAIYIFTQPHYSILFIGMMLSLLSLSLLVMFGEIDFSRLRCHGPYQVGFKEFRTEKFDNAISVFYPITKEHHKAMINQNDTAWLRDGDKTLEGIARASARYG